MSMTTLTTMDVLAIIALGVITLAGIAAWLLVRKRRTERLRARFGGAEYARAMKEGGSRRRAESGLERRTERVERFQIRRLALVDRARFSEAWRSVQSRFVDGPAGAVTEADQLLTDVMSTRGYPTSGFEQRAADISVDHPQVLKDYLYGSRDCAAADAGRGQHRGPAPGDGSLPDPVRGAGQRAGGIAPSRCLLIAGLRHLAAAAFRSTWTIF